MNKYHREIMSVTPGAGEDSCPLTITVDVYCVLEAFDVTCPALQHALKKLLAPGSRGHKSTMEDLKESRDSINRAIELEAGRQREIRKARIEKAREEKAREEKERPKADHRPATERPGRPAGAG